MGLRRTPAPPRPDDPGPGYVWVVRVETARWRVAGSGRCRALVTKGATCGAPAVAEVDRSLPGRGAQWYGCCAQHMRGRWVRNGDVCCWALEEEATADEQ